MHYGSLQGEPAAGCLVSASTLGASLVGDAFNVASVARTGVGAYEVLLGEECSPQNSTVVASPVGAGGSRNVLGANGSGDTGRLKHVQVLSTAGAPIDGDFYLIIVRSSV